jgi:broad specificity phosphatase PhoE
MIVRCRGQRVVWVVRQGEADRTSDDGLTRRGRRQAVRVAALLATKDIAAIYSSDDPGSRDTAAVIAGYFDRQVTTDPRLRRPAVGEPDPALHTRYAGVVDSIGARLHQGDVVIVVEGASIPMLRAAGSGAPVSDLSRGYVSTAAVCRVVLPAGHRLPQVGTAPTTSSTTSSTRTPSLGRHPMVVASPKLSTPPSLPLSL